MKCPRRSLLLALELTFAVVAARAQPAQPQTAEPAPSAPTPVAQAPADAPSPPPSPPSPANAPTPAPAKPAAPRPTPQPKKPAEAADLDMLYLFGKQLFDEYAPEQIKEQFEFPSAETWQEFTGRLQKSLEAGSLEELAALEPEARRTLIALRRMPDYADYADWLAERLDLMETARVATTGQLAENNTFPSPAPPSSAPVQTPTAPPADPALAPATPPTHPLSPDEPSANDPRPLTPAPTPDLPPAIVAIPTAKPLVPYYDIWFERIRTRRKPARADELMPLLKVIFVSEGLPPELVWLAEVESSLNPNARSPAGARGLFQLMPATARSLGLSTFPLDERSQPGKSARAAARLLRLLHARFDSWPLALAAYNAGEGRVAAMLKRKSASAFHEISESLPAETRMYVPKVLATVAIRENMAPDKLAAPAPPQVFRTPPAAPVPAVIAAAP